MASLAEHNVYVEIPGRVFDNDEKPAPDVISVGMAALSHGTSSNPLAEFNEQFDCLRKRRHLVPVSELLEQLDTIESFDPNLPIVFHGDSLTLERLPSARHNITVPDEAEDVDDETIPELVETSDGESAEDIEHGASTFDDEDLFSNSPTLTRFEEGDVSLDMDGGTWFLDEEDTSGSSVDSDDGSTDEDLDFWA
ncbi:hypothetical protein Hypma_005342 [Hypsizygus marmoreus]|uniref:Uncharacterized protein n=1 Tax=Hypsizygus marmoreus TaxID=39966 RepID=A0A369K778_HYPMA|nr:hypothetical protein Hypma_005342 [Hypsizygus marmoreus]